MQLNVAHYPNTVAASVHTPPRIVSRKGSLSAPDPFGEHVNEEKSRHVRSRLTLVRVPSESVDTNVPTIELGKPRPGRAFSSPIAKGRLSFSTSTFSDDATSPARHSSFSSTPARRHSGSQIVRRPSLSAHQICELASSTLKAPVIPEGESPFRHIPASYYLPFLDRPTEVTSLLTTKRNVPLMTLLSLTFPVHNRNVTGDASKPPTEWSYSTLWQYMTTVDRCTANDIEWLGNVRKCIRAHSEIMWERIKDVLGVLPEVDADDPFYQYGSPTEALEVAVALDEISLSEADNSPESEPTNFGVDCAWLEPVFEKTEEEREREKRLTMSPGGMETIGEEEEEVIVEEVDEDGQKKEEEKEENKRIAGMRLQTPYLFIKGAELMPEVKNVASPVMEEAEDTVPEGVPTIQLTTEDETSPSQHTFELDSPPSSLTPATPVSSASTPISTYPPTPPPPFHRSFTLPSLPSGITTPHPNTSPPRKITSQPPKMPVIRPITSQPVTSSGITAPPQPRRRHTLPVEPRFPTTFARLGTNAEGAKEKLAQRIVHAGVVH